LIHNVFQLMFQKTSTTMSKLMFKKILIKVLNILELCWHGSATSNFFVCHIRIWESPHHYARQAQKILLKFLKRWADKVDPSTCHTLVNLEDPDYIWRQEKFVVFFMTSKKIRTCFHITKKTAFLIISLVTANYVQGTFFWTLPKSLFSYSDRNFHDNI